MRHMLHVRFAIFLLLIAVLAPCRSADALSSLLTSEDVSWLQQNPVVNVRISKSYPPFEFFEDGQYQGIAYDYLMLLGERLGIKFQPVEDMSWSESLESIKDKNGVDLILVITHTPERESYLNFTRDYISFPEVIFTRKNSDFVAGIKDLEGRVVAVEQDFMQVAEIKKDIDQVTLLEKESTVEALKEVSRGNADAYIGNLAVGTYLIDKYGLTNLKVAVNSDYGEDSYAMAIRKDWPEFAKILEKGLDSITTEDHRVIRNSWLAIRYEYGLNVFDIVKWVVAAILISLIFIIQLRRMVKSRTQALQQMHDNLEDLVAERTSDLKEAQDQLLVKERLAVLGQLTATVSHELRNPLGTISNALYNISAAINADDSDKAVHSIDVSLRNINRCDRIIDELLDYSRKAKPIMGSVDIDRLVIATCDEHLWPENVVVKKSVNSGARILGDEERLHRAVLNLLINAQQALQESPRTDKVIRVATEINGSNIEIVIEDNGPGIPEKLRQKIFEPLFSTKNFGVGLGMSIIKDIIELHQGGIRLEDREGGGCRFVLWMPIKENS